MNNRRKKWFIQLRTWLGIRIFTLLSDLAILIGAWIGAFWLRYNLFIPSDVYDHMLQSLTVTVLLEFAVLLLFRIYRITARFVSLQDLLRIVQMTCAGTFLSIAVLFAWNRLEGVPRSVPVLNILLATAGLGGIRVAYRIFKEGIIPAKTGIKTLIVGAGNGGEQLLRALITGDGEYHPVGFLDDSRSNAGKAIAGVKVLGRIRELPEIVKRHNIELAVLAIPSANKKLVHRFVELCTEAGISYKTLPSTTDLLSGKVNAGSVRDVTIEDLLGRDPVKLDWDLIRLEFSGKRVLVTGAGGSIGSELCRQLIKLSPERLILIENNEFALYSIEQEIKQEGTDNLLQTVLCDVRDRQAIDRIFRKTSPEIVFHAAAYKHVPMVEMNPHAGVKTNVFGTCNLAQAAIENKVKKFVMISTDKAVNPTNIMGGTKRIAELYCQNLNHRTPDTAFVTTRFGNVLGSSGSVVPLFKRQIAAGGPVTVTHPEIKRFFMTIPEACQLVLQAASMSIGGEIFVLDMGEPVKIDHLARQLIRLSGYEPDVDIKIKYIGLRPGEKLYEELFHQSEILQKTSHRKILLATSHSMDWHFLRNNMEYLRRACEQDDIDIIKKCIKRIVPEYKPYSMAKERQDIGKIHDAMQEEPYSPHEPTRQSVGGIYQ